jgi:prophage maintenance system killer protein
MGSEQDMQKNLPNIAGCIQRACQTYYETPEEQLIQIISSITVNHYLENGNKRTAVSAGVLYLLSYTVECVNKEGASNWVIEKMQHLKKIADSFANAGNNFESVKDKMIKFAKYEIFTKMQWL